jgi:hypothetical protein
MTMDYLAFVIGTALLLLLIFPEKFGEGLARFEQGYQCQAFGMCLQETPDE